MSTNVIMLSDPMFFLSLSLNFTLLFPLTQLRISSFFRSPYTSVVVGRVTHLSPVPTCSRLQDLPHSDLTYCIAKHKQLEFYQQDCKCDFGDISIELCTECDKDSEVSLFVQWTNRTGRLAQITTFVSLDSHSSFFFPYFYIPHA